jgi:hypothetical protein
MEAHFSAQIAQLSELVEQTATHADGVDTRRHSYAELFRTAGFTLDSLGGDICKRIAMFKRL